MNDASHGQPQGVPMVMRKGLKIVLKSGREDPITPPNMPNGDAATATGPAGELTVFLQWQGAPAEEGQQPQMFRTLRKIYAPGTWLSVEPVDMLLPVPPELPPSPPAALAVQPETPVETIPEPVAEEKAPTESTPEE